MAGIMEERQTPRRSAQKPEVQRISPIDISPTAAWGLNFAMKPPAVRDSIASDNPSISGTSLFFFSQIENIEKIRKYNERKTRNVSPGRRFPAQNARLRFWAGDGAAAAC
jgi:hypothetical protein